MTAYLEEVRKLEKHFRGMELRHIVTAPVWHTKIWAKFSLFSFHCIMAYLFKLLSLNKAINMGKQHFPNIPTNAIAQLSKPNHSWTSKLFRKFQVTSYNNLSKSKLSTSKDIKLKIQNWFKSNPIFETTLSFPKIQNRIIGRPYKFL